MKNETRNIAPTPETPNIKPAPEKAQSDSAEARQESAREIMVNFLAEKNIIASNEVSALAPEKVEELIVRTAHDYNNPPAEIPQAQFEKARRILGLQPNLGEGRIDTTKRDGEIKNLVEEMREYLTKYRSQHPEVLGMILCGSRMDDGKMPAPNSDVDVVLVLKEGLKTDSNLPGGQELVQKLNSFTKENRTASDFPVELDEYYAADELFAKLQDPADTSKLTWGWNPKVVKYIGDNVGDLDELKVNIEILKGLNSAEMMEIKADAVAKAKALVVRYLGQAKTK